MMEKEARTNKAGADLDKRNRNWQKIDTHLAEDVSQGNPHGIDALANKVWGNTITVTLINGWTGTLQYSKNDLGEVWLRGSLVAGTVDIAKAIGSITTGYLPQHYVPLVAYQSTNGLVVMFGCIDPGTGNILIRRNSLSELEVGTGKSYRINTIYKA